MSKFGESFRDLTLRQMEIKPFAIMECPQLCTCQICMKDVPREVKTERIMEKINKKPLVKQRRFSICEFKDDFLTICIMLQKCDSVVRPININIIDTVFLKNREYTIFVYYDQGLKFIKNKAFFHTEMENFIVQRKIDFLLDCQIQQIIGGQHPLVSSEKYYENTAQITNKLKQQLNEQVATDNIIVARYQTNETILLKRYDLHQHTVLSKTNTIFDGLLHLQLYLYNEKQAYEVIEINKRNPKDYYIHKYNYVKDNQMFSDIVCEQSYLTDPSVRGQRQWDREKKYSEGLELFEYFKYTCHKIAVFVQSFHKLSILDMEVHFTINYSKHVSIINVIGLRTQKAEDSQWVIKIGRTLSTAEKIQINDIKVTESEIIQTTERSKMISKNLVPFTKKIIEKIKPITAQVIQNNQQNTRTQEAFQTLNPGVNQSLCELLEKQNYSSLIKNFPKQLKRYQSMEKDSMIKSRNESQGRTTRESVLDDYIGKMKQSRRKKIVVDSPFLRTIQKRFFSRKNSADFL